MRSVLYFRLSPKKSFRIAPALLTGRSEYRKRVRTMASYETAKHEGIPVHQKVGMEIHKLLTSGNALFYIFGLASFYAWNLIDIFAQPIAVSTIGAGWSLWGSTVVSSVCNTAGYVVIALLLFRARRFKAIALAAAFIAGISGIAVYALSMGLPEYGEAFFFGYRGISRICAACVIVVWGSKFSSLGSVRITVFTLASFLIACVAYLAVDATEGFLRVALISLLLPASMVLLFRVQRSSAPKATDLEHPRSFISTTWRVLLVFYMFGVVTWIVILNSQARLGYGEPMGSIVAMASFAVVFVLLVVSLVLGSTFSLSYIYKLVLPMVMAGVALIIVFGFERSIGPAFVSTGFTCFDLFCFVMIADAANKTKANPIRVFGWCRAIESSLPLLSIGIIFIAQNVFGVEENTLIYLFAIACIVVMSASVILEKNGIFERAHLNPSIEYPRAEVIVFARQCEKAIDVYALSAREAEVLSLLVRGRSVPHIAERLYIARSTVKTHITRIYQKIGVESRQEMIDAIESLDVSVVDAGEDIESRVD